MPNINKYNLTIAEFVVIHNGIITNYKDIKAFLQKKNYQFESETDTETIAKLADLIYKQHNGDIKFRELVESVIQQLVSSTLECFKI